LLGTALLRQIEPELRENEQNGSWKGSADQRLKKYEPWALIVGGSDGVSESFSRKLAAHGLPRSPRGAIALVSL